MTYEETLTKDKILAAAINQYSQYGYHGATMQKIAKEVGIKAASIYFFYKNKEALFTAAFQKILTAHFEQMQNILNQAIDQTLIDIFQALLNGTVHYHKENLQMTNAYISLVTSPPAEIKQFLHEHMHKFDNWLMNSLKDVIQREQPTISENKAYAIIKQFILLLDGIFWEINLYDDKELNEQMNHALYMIEIILGGQQDE